MAFDLDVAKQLISQIRERSVGPRVMEDVGALLQGAVEEVSTLRGISHNLTQALTTVREQADHHRVIVGKLDALIARVESLTLHARRSGADEARLWHIADVWWWQGRRARALAMLALDE